MVRGATILQMIQPYKLQPILDTMATKILAPATRPQIAKEEI